MVRGSNPFLIPILETPVTQISGLAAYLISLNGNKNRRGLPQRRMVKAPDPGENRGHDREVHLFPTLPGSATVGPYDPIEHPEYPLVAYNIHDDVDDYCDLS